jgi:hypothetical protein
MEKDCIIHGEVFVFKSVVPKDAVKCAQKGAFRVVAPSETSGNHHVIDAPAGVEFYEKDGVLYMKNDVPTDIRCVMTERHDNITLPAGEWEIGTQLEYDPFEARSRKVAD